MLFWIFVIMFVVGLLMAIVNPYSDWTEILGPPLIIISIIALIIMIPILAINHLGVDGEIAGLETKREMLVWQLENDIYENDNDLGKRDLIEDIVEYNTSLARKQANQDDFWIGIFIPDIYDQFDFIELE